MTSMRRTKSRGLWLFAAASIAMLPACTPTYPTQTVATGATGIGSSVSGSAAPDYSSPSSLPIAAPGGPINGDVLTDYLKSQRLPLVSAQIAEASNGDRQVILSGFVATDKGKLNAESYTRRYLNDPTVRIDNRIKVTPELARTGAPAVATADPYATTDPYGSTMAGASAYQQQGVNDPNQFPNQYQYQSQNQSLLMGLGLLFSLMGGMNAGGSSFGYSGGFGSGYGYPNYTSPPPPPGFSPYAPGTP
ncbi:MAG: hypothetical protein ACREQF_10590 [Candidatus Binataceae bacterium]